MLAQKLLELDQCFKIFTKPSARMDVRQFYFQTFKNQLEFWPKLLFFKSCTAYC